MTSSNVRRTKKKINLYILQGNLNQHTAAESLAGEKKQSYVHAVSRVNLKKLNFDKAVHLTTVKDSISFLVPLARKR